MTDPYGIPSAITMALAIVAVLIVGWLVERWRTRRERAAFRLACRAAWRDDWLVGDGDADLSLVSTRTLLKVVA